MSPASKLSIFIVSEIPELFVISMSSSTGASVVASPLMDASIAVLSSFPGAVIVT
jgi:hypothetical protein